MIISFYPFLSLLTFDLTYPHIYTLLIHIFIGFIIDFLLTLCQLLHTVLTEVFCTLQLLSHQFETMSGRPRLRAYLFKGDIMLLG